MSPSDHETMIRSPALNVLIYECITAGILDFDYAPCLVDLSYKGSTKKIWMNISQEACTAIDELKMFGMIASVRMYTEDCQPITSYQTTKSGLRMIKAVPAALHDELKHVVYVPDKENTYSDIVRIAWDNRKSVFLLRSSKSGYHRESTVTDIEDVSYVCSPYIPKFLQRASPDGASRATNNRGRAAEAAAGQTNIKDADLMEAIALGHLRLLLAEFVPFGSNSIVSTAIALGALDRCKAGMFSPTVDARPADTRLATASGLTSARILDFDLMRHVNLEAEISYPEEEGIVQVEFFGVHLSTLGNVLFGLAVDSVMARPADSLPIDLLARLAVDVVQDSSRILHDVLNAHQRHLLATLSPGCAARRVKFACYLCRAIDPWFAAAAQYLDRGDQENELAQLVGQVRFGRDLGERHLLFVGTGGLLLVGPRAHELDAYVVPYCNLQGMMLAAGTAFERMSHMGRMLDDAVALSEAPAASAEGEARVQRLVTRAASESVVLELAIRQLATAVDSALMPPEPRDAVGQALYAALRCRQWQLSLRARATALTRLVADSRRKAQRLRTSAGHVNQGGLLRCVRRTGENVAGMVGRARQAHAVGPALWAVQMLLVALLLLRFLDKFRWGSAFCGVAGLNRTPLTSRTLPLLLNDTAGRVHRLGPDLYIEPAGGVYSADCPWIDPLEHALSGVRFLMLIVAVPLVVVAAAAFDAAAFLVQKRRRAAIAGHLRSWACRFEQETLRRQTHRVEVMSPVDVAALELFLDARSRGRLREHREAAAARPGAPARTRVQASWRESGVVLWRGMPPVVTVVYERESGFLFRVTVRVDTRLSGLRISEFWNILRRQLVLARVFRPGAAGPAAGSAAGPGAAGAAESADRDVRGPLGAAAPGGATAGVIGAGYAAAREWGVENRARKRAERSRRAERGRKEREVRERIMERFRGLYRPSLWVRARAVVRGWFTPAAAPPSRNRAGQGARPALPDDGPGQGKPTAAGSEHAAVVRGAAGGLGEGVVDSEEDGDSKVEDDEEKEGDDDDGLGEEDDEDDREDEKGQGRKFR